MNKFKKISISSSNLLRKQLSVKEQLEQISNNILANPRNSTGIYAIHSKFGDYIYIGSAARSFSIRWKEHISDLEKIKHTSISLQYIYCKHGFDNLKFHILELCSPNECLSRERYHMNNLMPELNTNISYSPDELDFDLINAGDVWYKTPEGFTYKKNTLIKHRQKWLKTKFGIETVRFDLTNLRRLINRKKISQIEKIEEIRAYCMEYYPEIEFSDKIILDFLNKGEQFEPFWSK